MAREGLQPERVAMLVATGVLSHNAFDRSSRARMTTGREAPVPSLGETPKCSNG